MDKLKKIMDLLLFIILMAACALALAILMMINKPKEAPVEVSVKEEGQIVMGRVIQAREDSPMEVAEWEVNVTLEELELMSRIVMNEAGSVPYIGKAAVAKVMINRLKYGKWGSTMNEVLNYDGAFSHNENGEISDECRAAVLQALEGGAAFPDDMLYFRDSHYHTFGYPYMQIGNLYFSTLNDYDKLVNGESDE